MQSSKKSPLSKQNERRKNRDLRAILLSVKDGALRRKLGIQIGQYTRDLEEKIAERTRELEIANAKLAQEKAEEEALLSSIGEGIIATDQEGKIIVINNRAEKMLGWKAKEVIGKPYFDIVPMEDEQGNSVPKDNRLVSLALASGKIVSTMLPVRYYYVRKNKSRFPIGSTVSPVVLNGKIIGAIALFRDVTAGKTIDRAKSEFVSLASHQLRTPLSIISLYGELVLSGADGALNRKQKQYLQEIQIANKRMSDLITALLNVSRIDMGTLAVESKPTNLISVATSVIQEIQPEILRKNHRFVKTYDEKLPIVFTDPRLTRNVLQNLLSNAVKYTPKHGSLALNIKRRKNDVMITVQDSGIGIPKNQHSKVFTKLFRADNAQEKEADGTGLGLYIVKSFVDQLGGTVSFKSRENKGAAFFVTLPLEPKIHKVPVESQPVKYLAS